MSDYLIGVDLGGTHIKAVAVTAQGHEYSRAHESTDDSEGAMTWRGKVQSLVAGFTNQWGVPAAIGLSAPGLAARDARSISYMPGRLQGLENFDWSDYLQAPVRVLNDAHAALLGEAWLGAVAGKRNVFLLTLGTGVGGAILSDGQLLRGAIGRAGHLGHITMNSNGAPDIVNTPGSLEDAIGDSTVAVRSDGKFTSTRDLVAAHQSGDAFASQVWLDSVRALSAGIASLINVLDPEAVVLGGGIMAAGDVLLEPLRRFLDEMEWRPGGHQVPIVPATLGDYAGALGAAFYSWQDADQRR